MASKLRDVFCVIAGCHATQSMRTSFDDGWLAGRSLAAARICMEYPQSLIVALRFAGEFAGKCLASSSDDVVRYFVGQAAEAVERQQSQAFLARFDDLIEGEVVDLEEDAGELREPEEVQPPAIEPTVEAVVEAVEEPKPEVIVPVVEAVEPVAHAVEVAPEPIVEAVAEPIAEPIIPSVPEVVVEANVDKLHAASVDSLPISAALKKALKASNLNTVGEVLAKQADGGLEPLPLIGKVSESKILEAISKLATGV